VQKAKNGFGYNNKTKQNHTFSQLIEAFAGKPHFQSKPTQSAAHKNCK